MEPTYSYTEIADKLKTSDDLEEIQLLCVLLNEERELYDPWDLLNICKIIFIRYIEFSKKYK